MDLKIYEPIRHCLKEFDNAQEFTVYYSKHKDELDKETTHKLNKMFKINGYKITRIKGELSLKIDRSVKKDNESNTNDSCEDVMGTIHSLEQSFNKRISELEAKNKAISDVVDYIVSFINSQTGKSN